MSILWVSSTSTKLLMENYYQICEDGIVFFDIMKHDLHENLKLIDVHVKERNTFEIIFKRPLICLFFLIQVLNK